eukprot:scaffold129259_cov36-Phaeocystis_antarctica.AAC.1
MGPNPNPNPNPNPDPNPNPSPNPNPNPHQVAMGALALLDSAEGAEELQACYLVITPSRGRRGAAGMLPSYHP